MKVSELLTLCEMNLKFYFVELRQGDKVIGYYKGHDIAPVKKPGDAAKYTDKKMAENDMRDANTFKGKHLQPGQKYVVVSKTYDFGKSKWLDEGVKFKTGAPVRRGYTVDLNDTEYKTLRKAKMSGDFSHPYKTVEVAPGHNNVTFKTSDPKKLARDLEKIIDAGETSWAEILNIA